MENKNNWLSKELYMDLLILAVLVMSYIINVPYMTLAAFVMACVLVMVSDYEKSVYHLAFFTSFARIFMYNGKYMYFVMIALFIIKSFINSRVGKNTLFFYLIIVIYSMLFRDVNSRISFAKMIGLILLFVTPLIAFSSDRIDCDVFMKYYISGFVLETVIGFFVKDIPTMYRIFDVDLMWTDSYQELFRFFGLSYDCNFYALSNFIIISYLLFAYEKISPARGVLIIFLLISGVQTISKSYFLVVGVLMAVYIIKHIGRIKRIILFAIGAFVAIQVFAIVSNSLGYNPIKLIESRFVAGGFAENSTGRAEIWSYYFDLFNESGIKKFLFGFGFNAGVRKAAHNTFIELMYLYGIIGLIIWGAFFVHCRNLFRRKTVSFTHKSPIVCISLVVGVCFLSAYTYESFWIGIVISLMTLGKRERSTI